MGKITLKRATTAVDLATDLALMAEYEGAEADLERLEKATPADRLNTARPLRAAAKRVQEIEQQLQDSIITVTMQALSRPEYNALADEHQPREGNEDDERMGVNTKTFYDVVIPRSIISAKWKKTGEAVEIDAAEWADLAEQMTDNQFAQFVGAVIRLNRMEVDIPFSRLASAVTRN